MQEADTSRRPSKSLMDRVKTNCLSMVVTCQEGFSYVKAFFVGQVHTQDKVYFDIVILLLLSFLSFGPSH